MNTLDGTELPGTLQDMADRLRLVALDRISLGRVVLTFEDGAEVIVNEDDDQYKTCVFHLVESRDLN